MHIFVHKLYSHLNYFYNLFLKYNSGVRFCFKGPWAVLPNCSQERLAQFSHSPVWSENTCFPTTEMATGQHFACSHHKLKTRKRQRGCYMPKVVCELWSLVQKTVRPASLYCMTLLKTDYCSPLNSPATVWLHSSLILFPWVATVTSRVNQWTKLRVGTHGKCYPYSNLVAQCDPGQGPQPQLCKGFSAEKCGSTLQEGSRD